MWAITGASLTPGPMGRASAGGPVLGSVSPGAKWETLGWLSGRWLAGVTILATEPRTRAP